MLALVNGDYQPRGNGLRTVTRGRGASAAHPAEADGASGAVSLWRGVRKPTVDAEPAAGHLSGRLRRSSM